MQSEQGVSRGVFVPTRKRIVLTMGVLALLMLASVVVSLALGRYAFSQDQLCALLTFHPDELTLNILLNMRAPRIVAALCVGGMLAIAGCAYQGLFRNPMVSPDLLGASAGAGFGAALGILLSLGSFGTQMSAFAFGFVAVIAAYTLSQRVSRGVNVVLMLVLCGMVVQNLFSAFTSAVKFVADPNSQLPEIMFWLMGGLNYVKAEDLPWLIAPLVIASAVLFALRWRLNVMTLGDEEAAALGVNTRRVRLLVVVSATLLTSAAVSIAGMVGWVGLIIPHLARFTVGSDHRVLIPTSFLMGSTFLLLVDDVCRSVYTTEIPLSILTAIIGAPLFVYLIGKRNRS